MVRRLKKRPMIPLFLGYALFLYMVIVCFPKVGTFLFGWERQETAIKNWMDQYAISDDYGKYRLEAMVKEKRSTKTGFRYVMVTDRIGKNKENSQAQGTITFILTSQEDYEVGDRLAAVGRIEYPAKAENPGQWDELNYARESGYYFTMRSSETALIERADRPVFSFLSCSRDAVVDRIGMLWEQPYSGIIAAMLCGAKSLMDDEMETLYQKGGISHVIAISGLHLSILAEGLTAIFSRLTTKRRAGNLSAVCLWIYAIWTGGATATLRAALMFSVKTAAPNLGRKYDFFSCYCFTGWVLLLLDPLRIRSASFYLSFFALLGLEVGPAIALHLERIPYLVRKWIAGSLGVTLTTIPITLWFYYQGTPAGLILNLWVLPTAPWVLLLSILALAGSLVGGGMSSGFVWISTLILKSYSKAAEWTCKIPWMDLRGQPSLRTMIFYYAGLILIVVFLSHPSNRKRWIIYMATITLTLCIAFLPGRKETVTYLSVGQGDCAVIEYHGITLIMDAGPSYETVIKPYLMWSGVRDIDGLFLSHPDADHMNGALQLSLDADFSLKCLYLADSSIQKTEDRSELVGNVLASGGKLQYLTAGDVIRYSDSDLGIRILWPMQGDESDNENDASLVAMVRAGEYRLLFTGDVSAQVEQILSEDDLLKNVDVLKAAHHGSRYSTSNALIESCEPKLTIISCGRNNQYGHPSPEVIERLEDQEAPYRITAQNGCIRIELKKRRWRCLEWISESG